MFEFRKSKYPIFIIIFIFLLLFLRLFQLQIIEGKRNLFLAENNRAQRKRIIAPRGLIFDRHGEILAKNEPLFRYKNKIISRPQALKLQEEGQDKDLEIYPQRDYPWGKLFSHLVGFLGEVSERELIKEKLDLKGYSLGSLVGRAGVEAQYESLLRGHEGSELIEVNTQGEVVRRMGQTLPDPGESLTLAVEKKLQETAAFLFSGRPDFKERKGAAVALNPQNGEILLFYSSPAFDPNIFQNSNRQEELAKIVADEENQPLFNRVISGTYPPGSTFKIVTAIAGLQEGKITSDTLINDPGVIYVGAFKFANWYYTGYGKTEGEINLVRAITRSTDTFFYKVGEYVGVEKLNFWAGKFNLDKVFGIDLPAEAASFVASPEWKEKFRHEPWFLGNTYHLAIGQGDLSLTPLAVNLMTAVVANGGKICTPRVLRIGAENTPYQKECQDLGIKKEFLDLVKQGMVGACSRGGTGWPFFDFEIASSPANELQHEPSTNSIDLPASLYEARRAGKASAKTGRVACKTGTAETGDGKTSHAWFTVFAPADEPEIVLTILVEKGGEGSSVAGPIAKQILQEYFSAK